MELNEIEGLTEEQIEQVKRFAQGCEDRVRTDYSKKLKDANEELALYKPVEKSATEKALEERVKAIEDREKELAAKERSANIASKLEAKGLPKDLASFIMVGENIDEDIEKVGTALGNYFLNSNYKPESHVNNKGLTKEQFRKMGYLERTKLYQENLELFKILNK